MAKTLVPDTDFEESTDLDPWTGDTSQFRRNDNSPSGDGKEGTWYGILDNGGGGPYQINLSNIMNVGVAQVDFKLGFGSGDMASTDNLFYRFYGTSSSDGTEVLAFGVHLDGDGFDGVVKTLDGASTGQAVAEFNIRDIEISVSFASSYTITFKGSSATGSFENTVDDITRVELDNQSDNNNQYFDFLTYSQSEPAPDSYPEPSSGPTWQNKTDWDRTSGSNVTHEESTLAGGYGPDTPIANPRNIVESSGRSLTGHAISGPHAVYDSTVNNTYVAWQDLQIRRATYDHDTGDWTHHNELANPQADDPDNHGHPSISLADDGTIVMLYGEHAQDAAKLHRWISNNTNDFSSGSVDQSITGEDTTYPLSVKLSDGTIICVIRRFIDTTEQPTYHLVSTDGGSTFTNGGDLVRFDPNTQNYRLYHRGAYVDSNDRIWFPFNLFDEDTSEMRDHFLIAYDRPNSQMVDVAGGTYTLPLSQTQAEQSPVLIDSQSSVSGRINTSDVVLVGGEYHVVATDTGNGETRHYYYDGAWNGPNTISTDSSKGWELRAVSTTEIYAVGPDGGPANRYVWDGSSWSFDSLVAPGYNVETFEPVEFVRDDRYNVTPKSDLKFTLGETAGGNYTDGLGFYPVSADATFVGQQYRATSTALRAYWPFDNDLQDKSGNNNDASNSGANTTPSTFYLGGSAVEFAGSGDTLTIPRGPYGATEFPFSVAMWIYPETTPGGQVYLFSDDNDDNNYSGISLYYDPGSASDGGDTAQLRVGDGSGGGGSARKQWVADDSFTLGTWNHVAFTIAGLDYVSIWINGVKQNLTVTDGGISNINRNGDGGFIGRGNIYNSGISFDGFVDEVRAYSVGLNTTRVQNLEAVKTTSKHQTDPRTI